MLGNWLPPEACGAGAGSAFQHLLGPSQSRTWSRPEWDRVWLVIPGGGLLVGGGKARVRGLTLRLAIQTRRKRVPRQSSGRFTKEVGGNILFCLGRQLGLGREGKRGNGGVWLEGLRRKSPWDKPWSPRSRFPSLESGVVGGMLPATFRRSPFQLPETERPHRYSFLEKKNYKRTRHPRPPRAPVSLQAHAPALAGPARRWAAPPSSLGSDSQAWPCQK